MRSTVLVALMVLIVATSTRATVTICPKGKPPADTLYVSDISTMPIQEQLFFSSLQGITAQQKPRIYLIRDKGADKFWLDWILKKGYIKSTKEVDPWELPNLFTSEIKGAVVYDPELSASVNVATMISGVDKLLICTPKIAEKVGIPIKADLRGKWKTNVEAYTWAMDNLYGKMNKRILCSLYPYAAGGWVRDYLIQHKIFTFWISQPGDKDSIGQTENEKDTIGKMMEKWPSNIPIIGFWYAGEDQKGIGEYEGLRFAGETGKFTVVYDWATNTSVHSGIRVPASAFKQKHAPKLTLDERKIYVMMTQFESGDAPWYWERAQYLDWQDPARGTFPMGWCLGPATLDLLPDVLEWHYENATPNDYFFCAMSGAGYTMTHVFADGMSNEDDVWRNFLELTREYMKKLDLDMVSLHTDAWHATPQYENSSVFKRYVKAIPELKAILADFGRLEALDLDKSSHYVDGVPVFHTLSRWDTSVNQADYLVEQMTSYTPKTRHAFMSIMALSWTCKPPIIKEAISKMSNDYIFVTPEQMADLFSQAHKASHRQ